MSKNEKQTLHEALNAARAEFKDIVKNSVNPHYRSKYADLSECLDAVTDALAKHGITLTQPIIDGLVYTVIQKGDEKLEASLKLPDIQDPQKIGSAITYYRRYTLTSLLALAAEDDDGNVASQAPKKVQATPVQTKTITPNPDGSKSYQLKDKKVEAPATEGEPERWYKYDLSPLLSDPKKFDSALKYMEKMQKEGAIVESGDEAYEYLSDRALEKFINLEVK